MLHRRRDAAPRAAGIERDRALLSQGRAALTLPPPSAFGHLEPGRDYEVVRPFTDFDRGEHTVGERWTYLTQSFLPYDDGLSLFVTIDGKDQQIRMRWTPDDQGPIVDALADYVRAIDG